MAPPSTDADGPWPHGYVSEREALPTRGRVRSGATRSAAGRRRRTDGTPERQQGIALVVVLTAVAILTVLVAELMQNTSTAFHVTVSSRDRLRAEYMAKSGFNLTRLLIAREPDIRKAVGPMYQMLTQRPPPQLNVWDFGDLILAPFADIESAKVMGEESGIDFSMMEGVADPKATFEVITVPENAKINVSKPLFYTGVEALRSTAMQLYALMGGYQSPDSPYDAMFATRDADGHFTTRLDVVSNMLDWADPNQVRTIFDPGSSRIEEVGSEDDLYSQYADSYEVKNAPFDSLEELRLIRGVGDDFWATFIEDNPDDPRTRKVTIYGSGAVNVNLAPPEVLLARLCSFVNEQPLCRDPMQAAAFIQLFNAARAIIPVALFSSPTDFLNFASAKPNKGLDIYALLIGFLGADNPLMMWTPLQIQQAQETEMLKKFLTAASIFTIQSTGRSGRAEAKMTAVVNFDKPWTPPKGVSAKLPPLGVLHHYRLE